MPLPLVERSEKEIARRIKARVESLKDVRGCRKITIRMTGRKYAIAMHVLLSSNLSFGEVHRIASEVEEETKRIVPDSIVHVHTEPSEKEGSGILEAVREIADKVPGTRGVYGVHIQQINKKTLIDMHLTVSDSMSVEEASAVAGMIERNLKKAIKNVGEVYIRIEPISELVSKEMTNIPLELNLRIEHMAESFPEISKARVVSIRNIVGNRHQQLVMNCYFDPKTSIRRVHEVSSLLEVRIKSNFPRMERIDIRQKMA
jgi:divalent metal cation (Fe/Co/Zn/Cd) transporter